MEQPKNMQQLNNNICVYVVYDVHLSSLFFISPFFCKKQHLDVIKKYQKTLIQINI